MTSLLMLNEHDGTPHALRHDTVEIWACSWPSPLHPERNEDAGGIWILPDRSVVLAVADGMGGTPQGADAAAIAIHQLDACLAGVASGDMLRAAVLDAFEHANRAIMERTPGSGSTLVVGALAAGRLRTYHVGDSAALLVGQRGRVKLETIAHSPVGYGVAAGLIDPESALDHEDRHYLSNHLGTKDMHIEMGTGRAMAARDTVLLASDGLLDNLSPGELIEAIRCGPLEQTAQRLAEQCNERMARAEDDPIGKPDDVSFLLLRRRVGP